MDSITYDSWVVCQYINPLFYLYLRKRGEKVETVTLILKDHLVSDSENTFGGQQKSIQYGVSLVSSYTL